MLKLPAFINKIKTTVNNNLWSRTNGVVVFTFGVIAFAADALEIRDKLFSNSNIEETLVTNDSTTTNKEILDSIINPILKKTTSTPVQPVKPSKVFFFNESEFLLEPGTLAIFVKNSNNLIDQEFIQRLGDDFNLKNVNTSISFFNYNSIPYYNQFYSANQSFLFETQIRKHINQYLIGSLKLIKTQSSADADITIINLRFQGKLVDVSLGTAKVISKEVRETNYQEHQAIEDAYKSLSKEIVSVL